MTLVLPNLRDRFTAELPEQDDIDNRARARAGVVEVFLLDVGGGAVLDDHHLTAISVKVGTTCVDVEANSRKLETPLKFRF